MCGRCLWTRVWVCALVLCRSWRSVGHRQRGARGGSDGWSGIGVYCHPPHSSCHPRFALLISSRAIQSPHVNTAPSPTPTHTPLTLPHTLTIAPPHSPPPSFSPHPPSPGYMNGILRQLQVARRRQRGTRLLGLGLVVGAVVGAGALAWMRR